MEWILVCTIFAPAVVMFILHLLFIKFRSSNGRRRRLPPGPKGWPLLGNIFDLGALPHRGLAALKERYGPVVWLRLGPTNTMVLLTANAAEELFKKHDLSVMNATVIDTMRSHDYHKSSMALAPYGPYRRALRRLCTVEMFTSKRIDETSGIRNKCVSDMLLWIEKEATNCPGTGIEVTQFVYRALFNTLSNVMLSRDLVDPQSEMATEFFAILKVIAECTGTPNVSDLFPWLRWLDLQGLRRKVDRHYGKALEIVSQLVKERVEARHTSNASANRQKDFLEVLLDSENDGNEKPYVLSQHQISTFILDLFMAGTETISTTIEWAMCELLRNPKTMIKTKEELAKVVGSNKKLEESDIDNMKYLQAVVKETFRLHSPVPLFLPRVVSQDINFMGYDIPKNTQVLVNPWAIGRDPEYWQDSLSFMPERFLGSNKSVDYRGQHFELIPFSAGRRICVAVSLAHREIHFILASLLHQFEWEIDNKISGDTIDVKETLGTTARKLNPLKAIPKRPVVNV